jgi:transcriptional regulator with XRE-family HTH domain
MKLKLGEKIRLARVTKGLSQQNVADELGLTVASYSNIERGVTDITVTRLYEISNVLGVTISEFIPELSATMANEMPGSYTTNWKSKIDNLQIQIDKHELEIIELKQIVRTLISN